MTKLVGKKMNAIKNAKILIVDDNELNRLFIKELLEINDFKHVSFVANAKSAYRAMEKNKPDLIVMDLVMPKIDGISACKTIKQNPDYQHIPIIMATVMPELEVMEKAFEAGVDDYVRKPLHNDLELVLRIHKLLAKTS